MEHIVSKEAVAEAPDLGAFQPVVSSSKNNSGAKPQTVTKSGDGADAEGNISGGGGDATNLKEDSTNTDTTATTTILPSASAPSPLFVTVCGLAPLLFFEEETTG